MIFRYVCPDNIFIEPVQNTNIILNIDRVDLTTQKQSNLQINNVYFCYLFLVTIFWLPIGLLQG